MRILLSEWEDLTAGDYRESVVPVKCNVLMGKIDVSNGMEATGGSV